MDKRARNELIEEIMELRRLVATVSPRHDQYGDGSCKKSCKGCEWSEKRGHYHGRISTPNEIQTQFLRALPMEHPRHLRTDLAWMEYFGWVKVTPIVGTYDAEFEITEMGTEALMRSPHHFVDLPLEDLP